jgi:GTP-binding protein
VPGKTTEINLFSVNDDSLYFLDLPGYGFARGSVEQKVVLQELIHWFIKKTKVKNRTHVMVLDAKVGLTEVDKTTLDFLYDTNEKIIILLNKVDKLNQKEYSKSFAKIQKEVTDAVTLIPFSAKTKKGVDEFWKAVEGEI